MDLLSDILSTLKLRGTFYFRTAFTPPWGVRVPAYAQVARFHYVHRGRCWLKVAGSPEALLLDQGDLAMITHGAEHVLSDPDDAALRSVDQVVAEAGFTGEGALVHGPPAGGHATQLICGHFAFDKDARHPLIETLPATLHIRDYGDGAHHWLATTLRLIASEAGRARLGSDLIALKLSEVIFAQLLRAYLGSEGGAQRVFAGFADPAISRVLEAVHKSPAARWTLETMAREGGMSRTAFAARFHRLMGLTPLAYLTAWRMQLARRLLADGTLPLIAVAERAGYRSEAAFARVFKRHFGTAPARYRREQTAGS